VVGEQDHGVEGPGTSSPLAVVSQCINFVSDELGLKVGIDR